MELIDICIVITTIAFVGFLISAYYAFKHIAKNKQAEKLKIYKKQINELQIRLGDEVRIKDRLRAKGELHDKYVFNCGGFFASLHRNPEIAWQEYKNMHKDK